MLLCRNPTPHKEKLLQYQIWSPINPASKDVDFLDIGRNLVMGTNPHKEDVDFWEKLYEQNGVRPYDTY